MSGDGCECAHVQLRLPTTHHSSLMTHHSFSGGGRERSCPAGTALPAAPTGGPGHPLAHGSPRLIGALARQRAGRRCVPSPNWLPALPRWLPEPAHRSPHRDAPLAMPGGTPAAPAAPPPRPADAAPQPPPEPPAAPHAPPPAPPPAAQRPLQPFALPPPAPAPPYVVISRPQCCSPNALESTPFPEGPHPSPPRCGREGAGKGNWEAFPCSGRA